MGRILAASGVGVFKIWFVNPEITGGILRGARVGVGWRVAAGGKGELRPVKAGCAVVSFWIGIKGSYVGKTGVVLAVTQEESMAAVNKQQTMISAREAEDVFIYLPAYD